MVLILPWVGAGRGIVSREPEAVTICCSFVPANWPSMACVMAVGGWMVRLYMNMLEVVAIAKHLKPVGCQSAGRMYQFCGRLYLAP